MGLIQIEASFVLSLCFTIVESLREIYLEEGFIVYRTVWHGHVVRVGWHNIRGFDILVLHGGSHRRKVCDWLVAGSA